MTVLLVAGSVTRVAAPNVEVMLHRARAAEIVGDVRALELAAFEYHAATRTWPDIGNPGEVPGSLSGYLPEEFSFERDHYTLTWRRWELRDGLPDRPEIQALVGVTVTIPDDEIGAALLEAVGSSRAHFTVGDNYTLILARESRRSPGR
ncbi:MAG: hypothetical protein ACOC8K_01860 [Gemmatimonadota bacterium]